MKLTGSRTSGDDDFFSDWDFFIDSAADFDRIFKLLDRALVWRLQSQGEQNMLTVVGPKGEIFKFSGQKTQFKQMWERIEQPRTHEDLHLYWILAFQQLKVLYREYDLLAEIGLERLAGLMRDIYLKRAADVAEYKSTYSYRLMRLKLADCKEKISAVTGLPYRNPAERLVKIQSMNQLVQSISPPDFKQLSEIFEVRTKWLAEHSVV